MSSMWMFFGSWVVMGLGGGLVLGRSIVLADRSADGHAPPRRSRPRRGRVPLR